MFLVELFWALGNENHCVLEDGTINSLCSRWGQVRGYIFSALIKEGAQAREVISLVLL